MSAPPHSVDVIVIGQGILGLSAAAALARAGKRVLSLERFHGHHAFGASWGDTRLIRKSYFEDARYLPLLARAYRAWEALEAETGRRLFHRCGLFLAGDPTKSASMARILCGDFAGLLAPLSRSEAEARFPLFRLLAGMSAGFEADAGYLDIAACAAALGESAAARGARRMEGVRVSAIRESGTGVSVETDAGRFQAQQVVLAAGAWLSTLLPDFPLRLTTKAAPQYWFAAPPAFAAAPCFGFFESEDFVYGFPARPGFGLKVAAYSPLAPEIDPENKAQIPDPWPLPSIARVLREHLPGVTPDPQRMQMCMYHLSEDENFVVAKAPGRERCFVLGACSGHAYKFGPALGDLLPPLLEGEALPAEAAFLGLRY